MSSAQAAARVAGEHAAFYRPELDLVRFGAFLLVFLHHALPHSSAAYSDAGLPSGIASVLAGIARSGELGVDLFFTLSAYLISELLLRERQRRGAIDIRAFYVRRILRIWPLYYAALFILTPAMRLWAGEHMPARYYVSFALFAGNWACAIWGYPPSSLALLWSVSIEEQFYAVWPWLVRLGALQLRRISCLLLAVATLTRVALVIRGVPHPGVWCNTLARLDPIAAGALLACVFNGSVPKYPSGLRLVCAGAGAILLIACGAVADNSGWPVVVTYPLAAAASTAIIA